jgi:double zinc ribbon protein
MALTEFVRNVRDLSDDGGYKFRFHCDRCNDGVESQYVSSAANLVKTGLQVFSMFRFFGGHSQHAIDGIDRGLRGKERDSAYEKAVHEAKVHFTKCSHCGGWVCPHCFNSRAGLCEGCAPDADEAAAKQAARRALDDKVEAVDAQKLTSTGPVTCPICSAPSGGGKFCQSCGADIRVQRSCQSCQAPLLANAKFCGECGKPA